MAEEPQLQAKKREANGRFPKGVSGNPGGRPKNNHTSIINLLEKTIDETMPGTSRTYKEAIVSGWLLTILNNKDKLKIAALKEALDRLYGKPKESLEVSGKDGGPLPVSIEYVPTSKGKADKDAS